MPAKEMKLLSSAHSLAALVIKSEKEAELKTDEKNFGPLETMLFVEMKHDNAEWSDNRLSSRPGRCI